jgi:hypothetical protein
MGKSTHSQRLENWLGVDVVERLSVAMRAGPNRPKWYGPPIAVDGVPGDVWATGDGDFIGHCDAGQFGSGYDRAEDILRRRVRRLRAWLPRLKRATRFRHGQLNTGFSSLSDLIAEATAGKRYIFPFQKAGATGVVAVTNSLWGVGNQPAAGANASAAPGGDALTDATTGAFAFTNPTNPDTQHFVVGYPVSSVAGNTLLLYDRLFQVNKTMNSTATEAVTGVPTRYQSGTATNADYIGGNFLFVEVGGTALAATAHNWTVCLYTDQASASSTLPSLTGNSGAIVRRLDHPTSQWFAPLESGDVGIKALTQMQASALVATGVINFVIGHPIAWMPCPVVNLCCVADGLNTSFNLVRIFDDAAMAFLEVTKPATTATTYTGMFETAAG